MEHVIKFIELKIIWQKHWCTKFFKICNHFHFKHPVLRSVIRSVISNLGMCSKSIGAQHSLFYFEDLWAVAAWFLGLVSICRLTSSILCCMSLSWLSHSFLSKSKRSKSSDFSLTQSLSLCSSRQRRSIAAVWVSASSLRSSSLSLLIVSPVLLFTVPLASNWRERKRVNTFDECHRKKMACRGYLQAQFGGKVEVEGLEGQEVNGWVAGIPIGYDSVKSVLTLIP